MASSRVVVATNQDQPRNSSSSISTSSHHSLPTLFLNLSDSDHHHHHPMDDLLNSIYPTDPAPPPPSKTADDVWKEIVAGNSSGTHQNININSEGLDVVTLEDYLIKERVLPVPIPSATAGVTTAMVQFGNGVDGTAVGTSGGGGGGGKGKRRVIEETIDKATLQKQRRMIKNRESAARSRERKQAYTSELEYLVNQLEQENARLLNERVDKQRQRFKQLMECIIPIDERPGPPKRSFRRTDSAQSM
ncbi:hypothetical protein Lal_00021201 [Lupinus albus]|uniref:Putative transcription factor bZIP family n=1 Tax=Lupinus albus TaxID=3870 RepID=A0A6A4QA64_LUPAL|nr:putative transcription factor bZIP family [Lupinus albus]KAF1876487.1 hypothetical protein Lal_00021201 [Lupinus albus]